MNSFLPRTISNWNALPQQTKLYINKMFKKKRRFNADIMKLCISALGHAMK